MVKKITCLDHLEQVPKGEIVPYIKNLLEYLLEEYKDYCPNGSIEEAIGVIYFIDTKCDMENYLNFGLKRPIEKRDIEWIKNIDHEFVCVSIVLDNDRGINIICKSNILSEYLEE